MSILPSHSMPMFKRSLFIYPLSAVNLPSIMLVIPESVSYTLCYLVYSKTYLIVFHVDDGGFIMDLLWWVYSYRIRHLIQELNLGTKTSTLGLHALMVGYLTFNMSSHHWLLIERYHRLFNSKSFIHTWRDVLRYLGNHWHQWWFPSCLLTVYIIDW